uniref:Uncharacterized protein n=1 Tax=Octopus bimaculoides TaxID=37653 RepID=A0A0L8GLM2_OCTBM
MVKENSIVIVRMISANLCSKCLAKRKMIFNLNNNCKAVRILRQLNVKDIKIRKTKRI